MCESCPATIGLYANAHQFAVASYRYRGNRPGSGRPHDYTVTELRGLALVRLITRSGLVSRGLVGSHLANAAGEALWGDGVAVVTLGHVMLAVRIPPDVWAELGEPVEVAS